MTEHAALSDTVTTMSEARNAQLTQAAQLLIDARKNHSPIAALPAELQPQSLEEAAYVHGIIIAAFGPIGGWKIGAGSPDATPFFAPMPVIWMVPSGTLLEGPRFRFRVLEAEIAFKLGKDLPPRATPYTRDEVVDAIASCHPIIEELESGLIDPKAPGNHMSALADLQMHGGFIYGPACPVVGDKDWKSIDFKSETVKLTVNGKVEVERTGSNTSGDLMRLLPYLANEGAARTGGLKTGQWITTGSWTGNTPACPGSLVEAAFARAGRVSLRFA
ncbi:MAG: 2-keto-4-pentenoate hydratase [Acidobacteriaceae bacterium]